MSPQQPTKAAGNSSQKRKRAAAAAPTSSSNQTTKGNNHKATTTTTTKKASSSTSAAVDAVIPPPLRTLVIDNGGDTLKYGWADATTTTTTCSCQHLPNVTARLPQQWTILAGDQLTASISNPNQCLAVTRSTERGMITNLGNQIQVWKRLLDLLSIRINSNSSTKTTEAATVFGWKQQQQQPASSSTKMIPSHTCAVLLALPPHCPRSILDGILTVWFEDFGFGHVGFCISPVVAAVYREQLRFPTPTTPVEEESSSSTDKRKDTSSSVKIACVVDLGWSAIHIVPIYNDKIIRESSAIRRMPLGARHLINIWKYYCSYRQWNLMDQEWILRDVFEKTAYVSLQFDTDMKLARRLPAGRRPYDCEFLLPDYQTTFAGTVQIPAAVQRQLEKKQHDDQQHVDEEEDDDYDEENDEDFEEKDAMEEDIEDDGGGEVVEEEAVQSDEDESPEEIRKRLLQQRAEEEKRRRELEAEQQVLNVTVERFAIPEALFRPSDAGLPSEWASLPAAIVQAIEACPVVYRAGLYQSIQLTGGLSQLPNLKERLERELRALAPAKYPIDISTCSEYSPPIDRAWNGARKLASEIAYTKWSISRNEWESASKRGAWKRLLMADGGYLV